MAQQEDKSESLEVVPERKLDEIAARRRLRVSTQTEASQVDVGNVGRAIQFDRELALTVRTSDGSLVDVTLQCVDNLSVTRDGGFTFTGLMLDEKLRIYKVSIEVEWKAGATIATL